MITDKTNLAEAKFLNKLSVRNCTNLLMTSNDEYCVHIDEGFSDRRYFILEEDSSNANDQQYYNPFHDSCTNPNVHLEVYKFLKSRDISQYNPGLILETEENAKYRMKAITFPVQFVQYYIEAHLYVNFPRFC